MHRSATPQVHHSSLQQSHTTAHTSCYAAFYTVLKTLTTTADSLIHSTFYPLHSCNARHTQIHIRCCGGDSNKKKSVNTRQKAVEIRVYISFETSHISNMPHTINNVSNNNDIMILYTIGQPLIPRHKFITPLSYFRRKYEF